LGGGALGVALVAVVTRLVVPDGGVEVVLEGVLLEHVVLELGVGALDGLQLRVAVHGPAELGEQVGRTAHPVELLLGRLLLLLVHLLEGRRRLLHRLVLPTLEGLLLQRARVHRGQVVGVGLLLL